MCSGRFGSFLFLTLTKISLCSSLSRDKTGQTLALANSCPGGMEIPKEVKKDLCISERIFFLLLPDALSNFVVWAGERGEACPGGVALGACFLPAWKTHLSPVSS